MTSTFDVYDTTLRDGAQQEGLNLSVADKLTIARQIDGLGVGYIEGGWPGANPKDTEFFRRAREELHLENATLAAFGATRRAGTAAADDPLVAALRDSGASVVTLVAKSHDRHVELALRTTLEENLAMVRDTVAHLTAEGQRVFLDAEHFFDGYRANRDYALEVLRTAFEAGAEVAALCDTNGGMLPDWVADVVDDVIARAGGRVGIHCHNDTGCAVANTLSAVDAGATHVQGTLNGYGERTGNADLVSVVANLELKLGRQVLPNGLLREATRIAHAVADVTNVPPASRQPYVGRERVHAQGRPPRQRDQGRPGPVPAHEAGGRRQRHATAGLRHGGPGVDRAQGPRAGLRPLRRQGPGRPGDRPGQADGVAGLHLRGGRRVVRAAAPGGARGCPPVVRRGRVVARDHRDEARRGGGLRGDGEAARRRRQDRADRRGERTGQRPGPGAAGSDRAGLPGGRRSSS